MDSQSRRAQWTVTATWKGEVLNGCAIPKA